MFPFDNFFSPHESHSLYKFPMNKEHSELLNHLRLPERANKHSSFFCRNIHPNCKDCSSANVRVQEDSINCLFCVSHLVSPKVCKSNLSRSNLPNLVYCNNKLMYDLSSSEKPVWLIFHYQTLPVSSKHKTITKNSAESFDV